MSGQAPAWGGPVSGHATHPFNAPGPIPAPAPGQGPAPVAGPSPWAAAPTPPPAPAKKGKGGLIAAIVAVVVLLVGGAGLVQMVVLSGDSDSAAAGGGDPDVADVADEPGAAPQVDTGSGGAGSAGGAPSPACPANSSRPEIQRYWADSQGIHVVIVIHSTCATPQVFGDAAARFGIFAGGEAFAQASFDLSGDPVAVPANGTSGEIELLFGPESTLNTAALEAVGLPDSEASSVSEGFDLRYVFVCTPVADGGGASGTQVSSDGPADLGSGAAAIEDSEGFVTEALPEALRGDAALAELQRIASADAPFVRAQLYNRWVPQLSSKALRPENPISDANRTYLDHGDILDNYRELKAEYPSLKLIFSSDYASFSLDGFWVMVLGESYLSPEAANGWCDASGRSPDDCFAKRISDGGLDDNTEYR